MHEKSIAVLSKTAAFNLKRRVFETKELHYNNRPEDRSFDIP